MPRSPRPIPQDQAPTSHAQSQRPRVDRRLGRRIASRRALLGWTQQDVAERVGISRVAVSDLETGMSVPSERTVVLLAGLFKSEPHELVDGTDYPKAKVDRLPLVAARHTRVELDLALLERDLSWLDRGDGSADASVLAGWRRDLGLLAAEALDPWERQALAAAATLVGRRLAEIGLRPPAAC